MGMGKLENKVALVTGGNSGIGLATALAFAGEGAQVVITGRDLEALESAKSQIGPGTLALVADVRRLDDLQRLFAQVAQELKSIDVLFVNAGLARLAPLESSNAELYGEVMNTNVKGAFLTLQGALPLLRSGASVILNGRVNAHVGYAGTRLYSASKAAVHSFARTLTPELQPRGIRINTLTIGPVSTPLFSKVGLPPEALQNFARSLTQRLPIGRFGEPDEIARAAVFLASDESSSLLGSELVIDGGLMTNGLYPSSKTPSSCCREPAPGPRRGP